MKSIRDDAGPAGVQRIIDMMLKNVRGAEKKLLKARYGLGDEEKRTFAEIGKSRRLSRQRVHQLLETAKGTFVYVGDGNYGLIAWKAGARDSGLAPVRLGDGQKRAIKLGTRREKA